METNSLPQEILTILRRVLPDRKLIGLHEPVLDGNEKKYLLECVDSTFVSSVGPFVDRFERDLTKYTGMKHAVAVVNGTAALQISLTLGGLQPGEEVLMPALTFVATANAVVHAGGIPHFVDSGPETLGVDPGVLADYLGEIVLRDDGGCINRQTGRRIRSLVPMHTFGHPVEIDRLAEICERNGLVLIEDAAESLGTLYKGKFTGQWTRLSAMSFNGNKIVTTGGGGAVLTNDSSLAQKAKHLTTTAKRPHRWAFHHDETGFNFRMPNINAALGCAQLERIEFFVEEKRALAARYEKAFEFVPGVSFFKEPAGARSNYWLNCILLADGRRDELEKVLTVTNDAGINTRPAWELMHQLPMYRECPRMNLPVAENIAARLINLPSSVGL